jgi:hypothetical protein
VGGWLDKSLRVDLMTSRVTGCPATCWRMNFDGDKRWGFV